MGEQVLRVYVFAWALNSADRQKHTQPSTALWPRAFMNPIVCGVLLPYPDVHSDHRPYVDGCEKIVFFSEDEQGNFSHFIWYKMLFLHLQQLADSFHTFVLNLDFFSSFVHVLPVSFAKRVYLCCGSVSSAQQQF